MKVQAIVFQLFVVIFFLAGCNVDTEVATQGQERQLTAAQEPTSHSLPSVSTVAAEESSVETAPDSEAVPAPDVLNYLNEGFCDEGLCGSDEGWREWIIIDNENPWCVTDLALIHTVLLDTITALDDIGLEGRTLLAGYRLRKVDKELLSSEDGRRIVALVSHSKQEVSLSRAAFLRQQGFPIYHEMGHIIDERLNREFTANYQALAGSGSSQSETVIADGYWLREKGREHSTEGTADAFAVWVMLRYAGKRCPVFPNTPVDIDYNVVANAVVATLTVTPVH